MAEGAVTRVLVVDDEPMVCAHLRTILGSAADLEVVAEAHDTRPPGVSGRAGGAGARSHADR
jgi:DNA-binding NarL/FixJ family response regulator